MRIEIIENDIVVNTIMADETFAEANYPSAWRVAAEQSEPPPAVEDSRITKLAFRNRFTQAEKAALEFAALDDPSAATPQRMQSAALRAYLKDVESATFIDLSRPDLIAGVQALEVMSLLAAGRAMAILSTPIEPHERPQ